MSAVMILNFSGCRSADTAGKTAMDMSATGTRNNEAVVLTPEASGREIRSTDTVILDISNTDNGYFMMKYTGNAEKAKMQVTTPENITYTYTIHDKYDTFPLTGGNGTYHVTAYEEVKNDMYSTILSEDFDAEIKDKFSPWLYPNQYVDFTKDSAATALGEKLAKPCSTDIEVVTNIYDYCFENIKYDNKKAKEVESGYLPDVDEILRTGKGICFDYSAVMAAMLRTQRIPTRMEIGYVGKDNHAWISVYLKESGWVNGIIEFDGKSWKIMDPTMAASKSERQLKSFIGDGSGYITKYIY